MKRNRKRVKWEVNIGFKNEWLKVGLKKEERFKECNKRNVRGVYKKGSF